eukprot:TRINITY_DN253_c0_g1_i1.p1 TRINITY_DN253_c0_g1~~TRINITY_DN253_c0_g1_i1.p1  ORF type:complete len:359 (+),score=-49.90 TRINITY_DN253_c0_g1_i1:117-1079(+)
MANSTTDGDRIFRNSKKNEGASPYVNLRYHNGPVLSHNATVHIIWYGRWSHADRHVIKDFLLSISEIQAGRVRRPTKSPSVREWWKTVGLYTDQTGANVTRNLVLGSELNDHYSQGKSLLRIAMNSIIKSAVTASHRPLPVDARSGLYLLLTSPDVSVQDFCRAVCGFHYFTFPAIVGYALPYAWVGHSGKQCPGSCAYPFAVPPFLEGSGTFTAWKSPNGNAAVDGMISVIGHELAEMSSNPLANAWYAGEDASAPTEIADLCEGIYGTGAGGSYAGQVLTDAGGASFNVNGVSGRKYLVQWLWSPVLSACFGPNALDE